MHRSLDSKRGLRWSKTIVLRKTCKNSRSGIGEGTGIVPLAKIVEKSQVLCLWHTYHKHSIWSTNVRFPDREYFCIDHRRSMTYYCVVFPIGNCPVRYLSIDSVPIGNVLIMTDTIKESPKVIGEFVRTRRQANNLTQQELGELAGVGTRFISELERGKPTLRMDAVNRVLRVFGQMLAHIEAPRDEGD